MHHSGVQLKDVVFSSRYTQEGDFTDDHSVLQLLECEFHSADYHTILDVVTGLKTAVALLEKVTY